MTEESNFRKGVEELKKIYKEEFKKRQEYLKKLKSLARKQKLNKYLAELENMLGGLSNVAMEQIINDLNMEAETEEIKTEDLLKRFKEEVEGKKTKKTPQTPSKTLGDIEEPEEDEEESSSSNLPPRTLGDNEF